MPEPVPPQAKRKLEWWFWPLFILLVCTGLGLGYLRTRSRAAEIFVEGFYAVSNLVYLALAVAALAGWIVKVVRRRKRREGDQR